MSIPYIYLLAALLLASCGSTAPATTRVSAGYDLSRPESVSILPDTLHEVSGLTDIDANTVACIQDENGVLFLYDLVSNTIKEQFQFHIDGDYEGVTRVGDAMFILRSDATLFEVDNYRRKDFTLHTYPTAIPAKDNEGLCFDEAYHRLLIACKSKLGKGAEFKDKRAIYAFDLHTKQLLPEPVFEFDVQVIKEFAAARNISLPQRTVKRSGEATTESLLKFKASAISVHPIRNELYLLSASDHLLFIFDMKGQVLHVEALDPKMFNKAEGITFMENGDMLISNEGQDHKPTLLLFKYLP